jgi:nucleoside-diphosphate-sugar epimerase
VGKLVGEHYCSVFSRIYGLPTVALRYFNVFGPHQRPDGPYAAVVPKFIGAMLEGRAVTIYGDGRQSRDFTHVANVVDANINACHVNLPDDVAFNIGCGESLSVIKMAHLLERFICAEPPSIVYEPPRPGDVMHSLADIGRAKTFLGYQAKVNVVLGLQQTAGWFKARNDSSVPA